jgi:hypothetical protein
MTRMTRMARMTGFTSEGFTPAFAARNCGDHRQLRALRPCSCPHFLVHASDPCARGSRQEHGDKKMGVAVPAGSGEKPTGDTAVEALTVAGRELASGRQYSSVF